MEEELNILYIDDAPYHTNIPDEAYDDMAYGWDTYYFGGLKEFFEK